MTKPVSSPEIVVTESRLVRVVMLPLPKSIANMRSHWRAKLATKKAYWGLCAVWTAHGRAGTRPADMVPPFFCDEPPDPAVVAASNVDASAHLYLRTIMDDDNAMATLKWAVDYIAAPPGAYIRGDRRPAFALAVPRQTIDRRGPARVAFTLHYADR